VLPGGGDDAGHGLGVDVGVRGVAHQLVDGEALPPLPPGAGWTVEAP